MKASLTPSPSCFTVSLLQTFVHPSSSLRLPYSSSFPVHPYPPLPPPRPNSTHHPIVSTDKASREEEATRRKLQIAAAVTWSRVIEADRRIAMAAATDWKGLTLLSCSYTFCSSWATKADGSGMEVSRHGRVCMLADLFARCHHCQLAFTAEDEKGEEEEESAALGESWYHLTASAAANAPKENEIEQEFASIFKQMEEKRKINELVCNQLVDTYPLCESCTEKLLVELIAAKENASKECEMFTREYERLKEEIHSEEAGNDVDLREQIEREEEEERRLMAKVQALEEERISLRRKMSEIEQKAVLLEEMHNCYWRDYNELQLQLRSTDRDSLKRKMEAAASQLEMLNKTNVINDAFHISHNDVYGTINGFRLGSIQTQPVEWDEINAAWGQTTLLLQTLASNWDFTFPHFRLVPMGSFSRIIKRDDDKCIYDLFCASDIGLSRIFGFGSFDKGMAAFLECVRALQDHVKGIDPTFSPPYRIVEHKVCNRCGNVAGEMEGWFEDCRGRGGGRKREGGGRVN
eukprot:767408-Hanusia_phi.AAC.2